MSPEIARLAYLFYESRRHGFAHGILQGKMPSDAMETWRARVRASMDQRGPHDVALQLFERLGMDWDAVAIEDRRWVNVWQREMQTREPADGDRSRVLWWPALQTDSAISEALTGADLLRDWMRELDGAKPTTETIDPADLTPRQRLELDYLT